MLLKIALFEKFSLVWLVPIPHFFSSRKTYTKTYGGREIQQVGVGTETRPLSITTNMKDPNVSEHI